MRAHVPLPFAIMHALSSESTIIQSNTISSLFIPSHRCLTCERSIHGAKRVGAARTRVCSGCFHGGRNAASGEAL